MQGLARFIVSGRGPAFTVVFGFSVLAFIIPLSTIISAAAIVLITLYASPKQAALITFACISVMAITSYFVAGSPLLGGITNAVLLLPSLVLGSIFYKTRSLSFTIQIAAIIGIAVFIVLQLMFPDLNRTWEQVLVKTLDTALDARGHNEEQKLQFIQVSALFMNGALIAVSTLIHCTTLLLGYWWYCVVQQSQNFRKDFHTLRLGKVLAIIAIALICWTVATKSVVSVQLFAIVAMLFILQGMAIIHALTSKMQKGKIWLIVSYALLIFLPQALFILILTGIADTFINIRARIPLNTDA